MSKSALDIVYETTKGKMSLRPESYAGRGNNAGDLDTDKLESIYKGIKKAIGPSAAKAYVQMIDTTMQDDASATNFLYNLYDLENRDWQFEKPEEPQDQADNLARAVSDAERKNGFDTAFNVFRGGLGHVMGGSLKTKPGDGLRIVGEFLQSHSEELGRPVKKRDSRWNP